MLNEFEFYSFKTIQRMKMFKHTKIYVCVYTHQTRNFHNIELNIFDFYDEIEGTFNKFKTYITYACKD